MARRALLGWLLLSLIAAVSGPARADEKPADSVEAPAKTPRSKPLDLPPLDLPRLGTVGPVPSADMSIVISVARDGWIRVPDIEEPLSLLGLREFLSKRAHGTHLTGRDGNSRLNAVLAIDATTPWALTHWLIQTCGHPSVRIHKIRLGARTHEGKVGSVAIGLPRSGSLFAPSQELPEFTAHKVNLLKLEGFSEPSDLGVLYIAVKQRRDASGHGPRAAFEISTHSPRGAAVPHGYVLQVTAVCLAAGAQGLIFKGSLVPMQGKLFRSAAALKRHVDALREKHGAAVMTVDDDPTYLAPGKGYVPARGFVQQHVGVPVALTFGETEADLEETEEEDSEEDPPKRKRLGDPPFTCPPSPGGLNPGLGAFKGRLLRTPPPAGIKPLFQRQDEAVVRALRWLAAHQAPNGGWEAAGFGRWCDGRPVSTESKRPAGRGVALHDPGVTGLALQAFLGAGYTNCGKHPFAKVVSRGLRYLKNIQDPEGCFGPRSHQSYIYSHALCALAMVEAYGMTSSPVFKGAAQRALQFIAQARNPDSAWRYGVKPGDNDTSVTAWMLLALTSAKRINEHAVASGFPSRSLLIDESAFEGARAWLDKTVTDHDTGRVGYITRGGGSSREEARLDQFPPEASEAMTAAAVFARVNLNAGARASDLVKKGLALIARKPPVWDRANGKLDMYYWHWATLAMFQAGGAQYEAWRTALSSALLPRQRRDGDVCGYMGSWDPQGPWGADGGRVYSTALMALCLEVRYRYPRVAAFER